MIDSQSMTNKKPNPWPQIVQSLSLEPLDRIADLLERGPDIEPTLFKTDDGYWRVKIEGRWSEPSLEDIVPLIDYTLQHVNWTLDLLKDRDNCWQSYWNSWDFQNQKDAEQFILMFNLRWAK